eukprot:TRINITY_DN4541_c3_g1_i3.p1 TRINITY_DN4541_c3_g1~~TRINITY_DN4541_c3_g1_i3.p1  ORF type:complete len:264 (-),score=-22.94 TRINITY_DN4541_c3_g1_i3:1295-2086(-)
MFILTQQPRSQFVIQSTNETRQNGKICNTNDGSPRKNSLTRNQISHNSHFLKNRREKNTFEKNLLQIYLASIHKLHMLSIQVDFFQILILIVILKNNHGNDNDNKRNSNGYTWSRQQTNIFQIIENENNIITFQMLQQILYLKLSHCIDFLIATYIDQYSAIRQIYSYQQIYIQKNNSLKYYMEYSNNQIIQKISPYATTLNIDRKPNLICMHLYTHNSQYYQLKRTNLTTSICLYMFYSIYVLQVLIVTYIQYMTKHSEWKT